MVFRIFRPDSKTVWKNKEIKKRFSRYWAIIDNEQIARYLIAKTIKCEFEAHNSIEQLGLNHMKHSWV